MSMCYFVKCLNIQRVTLTRDHHRQMRWHSDEKSWLRTSSWPFAKPRLSDCDAQKLKWWKKKSSEHIFNSPNSSLTNLWSQPRRWSVWSCPERPKTQRPAAAAWWPGGAGRVTRTRKCPTSSCRLTWPSSTERSAIQTSIMTDSRSSLRAWYVPVWMVKRWRTLAT